MLWGTYHIDLLLINMFLRTTIIVNTVSFLLQLTPEPIMNAISPTMG
ncbi:hypothetical protein J2Z83_002292 [Virgibacillus natechei]|uniref:Uncharacterized protein n=1 Tax=Virgibacillus natechei TaxID=1216297 RepID=A0ABS4IGV0_9BACI|nr:hypothetical protein [Virgibacillus natechei]MBP1970174.1 hypothetical protein [Virgibacillus natechei]UZD12873.1 hypothetical protein OLD84_18630 [Virgibacillus natechei]